MTRLAMGQRGLCILLLSLLSAQAFGQSSLVTRCRELAEKSTGPAPAETADKAAVAESARLAKLAADSYAQQQFEAALSTLAQAYALRPSAAILYNMAQACREAAAEREALAMYEQSAKWTPKPALKNEALRRATLLRRKLAHDDGQRQLADQQKLLAEQQRQLMEQQAALAEERRKVNTVNLTAVPPAPEPVRSERPVYKRWWFWTSIGGAVAVAVVVGVVVANAYPVAPNYPNIKDVSFP